MCEKISELSNTPRIRQVSPNILGKEIPTEQKLIKLVLPETMSRKMSPALISIVHDRALEIHERKGQAVKA